jgi:hypothetical protein
MKNQILHLELNKIFVNIPLFGPVKVECKKALRMSLGLDF